MNLDQQELVRKIVALERRVDNQVLPERTTAEIKAWAAAFPIFMSLTGLRGFWPFSATNVGGDAMDQSIHGNYLTAAGDVYHAYDGLAPYVYYDGTGDYHYRADNAGLSITGTETYIKAGQRGLTTGGWFYPEDVATAQALISKWGASGNYSYILSFDGTVAGDPPEFTITDDGTNIDTVRSTVGLTASQWCFIAGRYNDADSGEELAIWKDSTKTTDTTARASIKDGNGPFNIASASSGSSLYTGRVSMAFICAAALSDDTIEKIYKRTKALFGV